MHSEQDVYSLALPVPVAPAPAKPGRLLPMRTEPEPGWKRKIFLFLALLIAEGYGFFLSSYWTPAPGRPGIDENGYLLGGRNLAEHGTIGFQPSDNFQFVGAMWIRTSAGTVLPPAIVPEFLRRWLAVHTKEGWYYPKYPAGVPLLNAIAIRLGGNDWAFAVPPVCASLAVLGMFFMGREVAGSFAGLLAMIALGANANLLEMANDPGSHAPALCFVVWGMFFLVRWWQTGRWWSGAAAGFLLGYAVTIRYTEALLLFPLYPLDQVLSDTKINTLHPHWRQVIEAIRFLPIGPLGLAALLRIRWRRLKSYFAAAIPILFWIIPVAALVTFNWFSMGHLTGYDTTRESSGFSVTEFLGKWDYALHELYLFGLFLLMPLGLAGLVMMFGGRWKIALLLTMWFVPGALLYTAYYWGVETPGVGFLRFFLTLLPPLIVAAMWLLCSPRVEEKRGAIARPLAAGLLVFGSAAIGLIAGVPELERQHRGNLNLHTSAQHILAVINTRKDKTARPMMFADEGSLPQLLQYMQFMIDADWYTHDAFGLRATGGMGLFGAMQIQNVNSHSPMLLQPERLEYMVQFMKGKTESDLVREQHRLMDEALNAHRPIYAILTWMQEADFRQRFLKGAYRMVELDHWREPCNIRFPGDEGAQTGVMNEQSPLIPSVQSGQPFISWVPASLKMFEIKKP